ncbi:hypothetical protein NDI45_08845 [Leptolyngbya sp. GB1-A1]
MSFDVRTIAKILAPTADFDSSFTFYYDETNNIRKFYVKENDFNSPFSSNFVLGGLVYEGKSPNIEPLFNKLNLQKNIKEVKLKHIAKGDFLDCLKSEKLNYFLKYLFDSNLYIHCSSLNILYWSIVDIVDSAIADLEIARQLDLSFVNYLKNDLYKLAKLEIKQVIELFYNFNYPNLKKESVLEFIERLTLIFDEYIDEEEFHFGLQFLRQTLKEARRNKSLPFIMNEEDHVLIEDFSHFYLRPLQLFKNSTHIFDNEVKISQILADYKELKNYYFIDSESNLLIQASDVFVGLMGKFTIYVNSSSKEQIAHDFTSLSEKQLNNVDSFIELINKSENKNVAFLHRIDSYEELEKVFLICNIRDKNHT